MKCALVCSVFKIRRFHEECKHLIMINGLFLTLISDRYQFNLIQDYVFPKLQRYLSFCWCSLVKLRVRVRSSSGVRTVGQTVLFLVVEEHSDGWTTQVQQDFVTFWTAQVKKCEKCGFQGGEDEGRGVAVIRHYIVCWTAYACTVFD